MPLNSTAGPKRTTEWERHPRPRVPRAQGNQTNPAFLPIPKTPTALEESNLQYEAATVPKNDERRRSEDRKSRATSTIRPSARSWRHQRARMSAPSLPAPRKLTAREESNLQYEATIASKKEEKVPEAQPECPICCVEFSNNQNSQHNPYSCPNDSCTVSFCETCKASTLEHDYRCPFCRCKLDGATLDKPRWQEDGMDGADLLAAASEGEMAEADLLIAASEARLHEADLLSAAAQANAEVLLRMMTDREILADLSRDGVITSQQPSRTRSSSDLSDIENQPPLSPSATVEPRLIPQMRRFPGWRGFRGY